MDPGNFLTDSGSKIPQLRREIVNVPQKPKLTTSTVKKTDYVNPNQQSKSSNLVRMKTTGKSVPNVSQSAQLARSKTNLKTVGRRGAETPAPSLKRQANSEDTEATATKVPKTTAKSGFNYKSKPWELKMRLAECEEWLTESKELNQELERTVSENNEALLNHRDVVQKLQSQTDRANDLQIRLDEKTESLNKLTSDSKEFLDKIEFLERKAASKEEELRLLQSRQTKLDEEKQTNTAEISKLRFSLDDCEFKLRMQKNTIDDLEASYTQSKKDCSELQSRLRERDYLIDTTSSKLDKAERENKDKENKIHDLEEDLDTAQSKIRELEKTVRSLRESNESVATELTSVKDDLAESRLTVDKLTLSCEEMRTKLCDCEKYRRYLHNLVQDLKGNIRVFCRVRPPLTSEKENCTLCTINYPDEGTIEVSKGDPFENSVTMGTSRPKFQKHEFTFDRVFNPSAVQSIVFDEISQLVQSALDGFNVCIFAYGQTGSGKTYTMEGPNTVDGRGMIPRTVKHIFETAQELEKIGWEYTVEVCFIEIYNEVIRDLLRSDKEGSNLKIMQVDGKTNDVVIPGLTVMKVTSCEDLDRLYVLAHQNRAVASTCYNVRSSRSHSITKIKVTGVHSQRKETCYGSLNLVDLAGSERLSEQASANDDRFREMKNINKSLSELGNVIQGLYQKLDHIPYRNSKLTHLLQPALGGSSKTLMLVNISPVENCLNETLCSLRFAQKVNQVKVGISKKRLMYDGAK